VASWLATFAFLFSLGVFLPIVPSAPPACNSGSVRDRDGVRFAHRCISTVKPAAQEAFDRGLTWLYAFNPEEARREFVRATRADPTLAIAWWGLAMADVPNINQSYDPANARRGRHAIAVARTLVARATPEERALIDAARTAFVGTGADDGDRNARAFRDAMTRVAHAYARDDDVLTFAAQTEMNVHPWSYFDEDGKPTSGTPTIIARLRTVLARDPEHLGANHFAIHAFEESLRPQDARASADRLARDVFAPAAEHLTHMPAHTFMRVGAYHEAGDANARAVAALLEYRADHATAHADYFGHDCAFGIDAFLMSGESGRARKLAKTCARDGADWDAVVDLRFGDWTWLARDAGDGDFANAMLLAHRGAFARARARMRALRAAHDSVASIETALVDATIARARGERATEIASLERAVATQDGFAYAEPPTFWYPLRESLGAALARAGRFAEAERVFREALAHDREDPRAVFGLAETLARAGRLAAARTMRERFKRAWRQADTTLDLKTL
jgi:Tfp pilus assembly protein PilF